MVLLTILSDVLHTRGVFVHLRDTNAKTCVRVSRRASAYFLCLSHARFDDNIALYGRKRVRNSYTRAGTCGVINIQFSNRIGITCISAYANRCRSLTLSQRTMPLSSKLHCQALSRVRVQETSGKLNVSVWRRDLFDFVDAYSTWTSRLWRRSHSYIFPKFGFAILFRIRLPDGERRFANQSLIRVWRSRRQHEESLRFTIMTIRHVHDVCKRY